MPVSGPGRGWGAASSSERRPDDAVCSAASCARSWLARASAAIIDSELRPPARHAEAQPPTRSCDALMRLLSAEAAAAAAASAAAAAAAATAAAAADAAVAGAADSRQAMRARCPADCLHHTVAPVATQSRRCACAPPRS